MALSVRSQLPKHHSSQQLNPDMNVLVCSESTSKTTLMRTHGSQSQTENKPATPGKLDEATPFGVNIQQISSESTSKIEYQSRTIIGLASSVSNYETELKSPTPGKLEEQVRSESTSKTIVRSQPPKQNSSRKQSFT